MAGPAGGNFLAPSLACQSQCGTKRKSGDYGGLTGSQAHRGGLAKHGSTTPFLSGEYFPHSTHESQAHLGRPINPVQSQHFFLRYFEVHASRAATPQTVRYAKAVRAGIQSFELFKTLDFDGDAVVREEKIRAQCPSLSLSRRLEILRSLQAESSGIDDTDKKTAEKLNETFGKLDFTRLGLSDWKAKKRIDSGTQNPLAHPVRRRFRKGGRTANRRPRCRRRNSCHNDGRLCDGWGGVRALQSRKL
jgi:hypothetical protein